MSTDIVSPTIRLGMLRHELANALAAKAQAEDAQHVAEEVARVAEERAHQAETERDDWAGFAHALADYYAIDQYADERLPDDMRRNITGLMFDDWSTSTPIRDLNVEPIVNGCNEELR
jgi:hypothetical protein